MKKKNHDVQENINRLYIHFNFFLRKSYNKIIYKRKIQKL